MQLSSRRTEIVGLFLPLYFPAFLFAFSNGLLIPILPLFAQSFHISYGLVGIVLAAEGIGMLIGDLPAAMLMGRLGQKRSMIIGLALTGFSTAALFLAPNIATIIGLRLIAGFGVSLFSVSRHYFLVMMSTSTIRGRVTSIYGGCLRIGRMVGPIVGGLVGAAFNLRSSFLIFGVACLLGIFVVLTFLPHIEVASPNGRDLGHYPWRQYSVMLRHKWNDLRTAGLGYMCMQIVRAGPYMLIPLFAANHLGMSVSAIGILISLSATLDILLFYPAGIMLDRWGRKPAIISSNLFLLLGVGLIPFTHSQTALLLVGLLAGLGNGLGAGCMLTLGSDLTPKQNSSEFIGAWTLIGDVGNSGAPLMIGSLAEAISLPATAWVIAASGLAALFIFLQFVPETLHKSGGLHVQITDSERNLRANTDHL